MIHIGHIFPSGCLSLSSLSFCLETKGPKIQGCVKNRLKSFPARKIRELGGRVKSTRPHTAPQTARIFFDLRAQGLLDAVFYKAGDGTPIGRAEKGGSWLVGHN